MSDPRFPQRLDIIDMPTDQFNVTGGLRNQLCKVANYCRDYPAKREFLLKVLKYTIARIEQIAEDDATAKAAKAKAREVASGDPKTAAEPAPSKGTTPAAKPATAQTKGAPSAKVASAPVKK